VTSAEYEIEAVKADAQAEMTALPEMAAAWRRLAEQWRELARTAYRRENPR
jgi:hypothetical protein